MRIYTRSGDDGTTGLLFGGRVSKADPRCEAYGAADHAVSVMGMARALTSDDRLKTMLLQTQREMFTVSAELATDIQNQEQFRSTFRAISASETERLEQWIDELKASVELPPKFIIPGASQASSAMDMARTAMRNAERRIVDLMEQGMLANIEVLHYVNRLGDLLFMMARYEDRDLPFDIVTGTRV
jgi:cob(I)alamin adenosyltransferase